MREHEENSSGFLLGILFGAIIGAVVAIIVYRHDKSKVLKNLAEKLEYYFKTFVTKASDTDIIPNIKKPTRAKAYTKKSPQSKITVELPDTIKKVTPALAPTPKPKKMFFKG